MTSASPGLRSFTIRPRGPFDLRESVEFGFGQRHSERYAGVMRLAFVLDGTEQQVGVALRQDPAGVHGQVHGEGDLDAVEQQVSRVLSLDVDGSAFVRVVRADPVLEPLHRSAVGLRPPLFYSAYEAAVWCVLSARRPAAAMAAVRARMSAEHGRVFDLAGQQVAALPTPEQLLRVERVDGLTEEKVARMQGVARAAQEGLLDVVRLRSMDPAEAAEQVRRIKGIGPFSAELIVVRALGLTDQLPQQEPRLLELAGRLYGRDRPLTPGELAAVAESWRPFRTWVAVLIRAASSRVLEGAG